MKDTVCGNLLLIVLLFMQAMTNISSLRAFYVLIPASSVSLLYLRSGAMIVVEANTQQLLSSSCWMLTRLLWNEFLSKIMNILQQEAVVLLIDEGILVVG